MTCIEDLMAVSLYVSWMLSKSFDRVNHRMLFKQLGVRGYILRILINWYNNQDMCVRWGDAYSAKFKVTNGVIQGGILSPYLFNHHHHIVSAMALSHRTYPSFISAISSRLGLSPKCVQLVMMWFRSHVAAPHIQFLLSR